MNRLFQRAACLVLAAVLCFGCAGCGSDGDAVVEKMLESIASNETLQTWFEENDIATVTESAVTMLKESVPVLKEFLAREDVQEKLKTVGLPLIEKFLSYQLESWRLKAETLAGIICIFAPELTSQVDAIFETAPETTENS